MRELFLSIVKFVRRHHLTLMWLGFSVFFLLLLYKNPYSTRSLISNFEPFPDTFHYVFPPRCWLQGLEWELCRPGMAGITPAVPILYSLLLIPVYLINWDPRSYFYLNLVLAMSGLGLFYLICRKLTKQWAIILLALFIYTTNYFNYWLPSLVMAENLLLPLVLLNLWLLLQPLQKKWLFLGALAVPSLYGVKFAAFPLLPLLGLAWLWRIWTSSVPVTHKVELTTSFCLAAGGTYIFFGGWKTVQFIFPIVTGARHYVAQDNGQSWYSTAFFTQNIPHYIRTLTGRSAKFLWDQTPLVPAWVSLLGWLGLAWGLVTTKYRFHTLLFTGLIIVQVAVISLFYTHDARYIYPSLPLLLFGVVFCLELLTSTFVKSTAHSRLVSLFIIGAVVIAFVSAFTRLKTQLAINFKYAETPWWYVSILELNGYFDRISPSQTPYVISPIGPYLIDLYATHDYKLLPLSDQQDFRGTKKQVWGEYDYSDFGKLYTTLLANGEDVYVAEYGIGNENDKKTAFARLEQQFVLEQVFSGCHDLCDIFRLVAVRDLENEQSSAAAPR